MYQLALDQLISLCNGLKGKTLIASIIGTKRFPFVIKNFDFVETDDEICFGEEGEENFSFNIPKSMISNIKRLEMFCEEDKYIRFKTSFDGFVDYIELMYDS
jgi:hypothetical protein